MEREEVPGDVVRCMHEKPMRRVCRKIYLQTLSSVTVVIRCIQFSIPEPANSIVLQEDVLSDVTACMKSRYGFNHCRIVPCTYAP